MRRMLLGLAWFAAGVAAAAAAVSNESSAVCRSEYVVPYAEQCEFAYKSLKPSSSARDLTQAFDTCARSQDVALPCVKSSEHDVHVVALTTLYRSVAIQGAVALYARQFRVAEALLREKLDIIGIVQHEARPGDDTPAKERAATQRDLEQARAGECTERALASAGQQYALGKAHKYAGLAALLQRKYDDYTSCARLVPVRADRAYVQYVALVALEESGRAAQAAGQKDASAKAYRACIERAARVTPDASDRVKSYLATVEALCKGRLDGTYAVDRPEPIDAQDGKAFKPLTLPK